MSLTPEKLESLRAEASHPPGVEARIESVDLAALLESAENDAKTISAQRDAVKKCSRELGEALIGREGFAAEAAALRRERDVGRTRIADLELELQRATGLLAATTADAQRRLRECANERDAAVQIRDELHTQLRDFGAECCRLMQTIEPRTRVSMALSALVATALSRLTYRDEHPRPDHEGGRAALEREACEQVVLGFAARASDGGVKRGLQDIAAAIYRRGAK